MRTHPAGLRQAITRLPPIPSETRQSSRRYTRHKVQNINTKIWFYSQDTLQKKVKQNLINCYIEYPSKNKINERDKDFPTCLC